MKSIKGGYQLISLGMVALGSLTSLPLEELAKIGGTTKRIVLTDVTLDGITRLPDIEVQIEKSGTDILLKDIYGKDLKIESDGDVTVATHSEFKLYRHTVKLGSTVRDDDAGTGILFSKMSDDFYEMVAPNKDLFASSIIGCILSAKYSGSNIDSVILGYTVTNMDGTHFCGTLSVQDLTNSAKRTLYISEDIITAL